MIPTLSLDLHYTTIPPIPRGLFLTFLSPTTVDYLGNLFTRSMYGASSVHVEFLFSAWGGGRFWVTASLPLTALSHEEHYGVVCFVCTLKLKKYRIILFYISSHQIEWAEALWARFICACANWEYIRGITLISIFVQYLLKKGLHWVFQRILSPTAVA